MPKPPPASIPSVAPLIAAGLEAMGFVKGPNESLAEALARSMGISTSALRAEFQRRASGL
jgi:hypothetical protein